ncbi:hypothetical protein ACOI1C_19015 [Bacillus sp. DJP31]|uniref:hypothetical protein n=1 Tax=Bacillus sp. DJP31 TaxID=3409789 RepID=UPI003BB5592B
MKVDVERKRLQIKYRELVQENGDRKRRNLDVFVMATLLFIVLFLFVFFKEIFFKPSPIQLDPESSIISIKKVD